jgi:putative addiction module component (TIGR02574 family)
MSTRLQSLLDAALLLPESERGELAARLMDTLDDAPEELDDDEWAVELKQRLDDYRSGKSIPVPWDEAMKFIMDDGDDKAD